MSLKILNRFPGGNAVSIHIRKDGPVPEVVFASDPCGDQTALWFHFKLSESDPDENRGGKLRLTWTFIDDFSAAPGGLACIPVSASPGHTWTRLKQGEESRTPEGLRQLSWQIPHPAPETEIALCFPYGGDDLQQLVQRSKGFWNTAPVGLSAGGRRMQRVFNETGSALSRQPGIYVIARKHAGETPGSWVLDGFLRHWAQNRKGGYLIWAHPFADVDGVYRGRYGRGGSDTLTGAWGARPSRREARIIQQDLLRWKDQCKPVIVLDLESPGLDDRDGVYAVDCAEAEETKWCNVIRHELRAEYAADDFIRTSADPDEGRFAAFVRDQIGTPVITLQIPYALAGTTVLTQKCYREIGARLASAIQKRKS